MKNCTVSLKEGYSIVVRNNSNILVNLKENADVRFLSPAAALAMSLFRMGLPLNQVVDRLEYVFESPTDKIYNKITLLLEKLNSFVNIYPIDEKSSKDNTDFVSDYHIDSLRCNPHPYGIVKRSFIPEKIVFNITDYCPRECIYCFNGAKCILKHKIKDEFISLERFEQVLDEAKKIGVKSIEIGGGDPFVRNDILDYLLICDKYFPLSWGTSTKAYISKEMAKKLSKLSHVDIQISLDSCDEETADRLMGVPGAYKQVLSSFDNLLKANIIPSAKMVITSLNCSHIKDTFYWFAGMGITTIRANSYMMSPNRHADYLYPSPEQIEKFNRDVDDILKFAKKNRINTDIDKISIPVPINNSIIDERVLCGASSTDMYIRYDGMMTFCGQINNCDDLTVGSLKTNSIMELWHSDEISNLYNPDYLKNNYIGTKCYSCNDYYKCYPKRCYVRSYTANSSFFSVDPACPHGIHGYINRG